MTVTHQTFKIVREPVVRVGGNAENFTPGKLYLNNVFFCETCEDEDRFLERSLQDVSERKVYGRTAIPRGKYRLTTSFSNRFQRVLPLVVDVPGFTGIRIHGGNRAEDSLGCILVGKVRTSTGVAQCAGSVKRVIDAIKDAAELGIQTWLEIA